MEAENRIKLIEEAIMIMKDLIIRHDERLDNFGEQLRESREDFNFKINALIDSQIRNETDMTEIKESIIELRKSAESTLKRVGNLEDKS